MITSNNKGFFLSNNQVYSNYTPTAEEINSSAKLTEQLYSSSKRTPSQQCGKRPIFTGKKRNEYNKCVADAEAKKSAPNPIVYPPPVIINNNTKTLWGMPQPVAISLSVVVVVAILYGGYKFIMPKPTMMNIKTN